MFELFAEKLLEDSSKITVRIFSSFFILQVVTGPPVLGLREAPRLVRLRGRGGLGLREPLREPVVVPVGRLVR